MSSLAIFHLLFMHGLKKGKLISELLMLRQSGGESVCISVCPRVALTHMCNSEAHAARQLYPLLYRKSRCMIDHIPILQFRQTKQQAIICIDTKCKK